MLKILRFGGLMVGAGLLVGAGVVVWLSLYPSDQPVASNKGGSVVLDATTKPDSAASLSGEVVDGASSPTPTPVEFTQYDKYRDNATTLFGDLQEGKGATVAAGSTLMVQYRGWLTNGTLFDESYSRSSGFGFKEGDHRVIRGWEEGLMGMKVGGKRRLIVPPALGYGADAHGPIPPNSVLVFDVELLSVQ